MQDQHFERLVGCFQTVFPNLNRSDIVAASPETVKEWDSVAHITLLSLIGEDFGLEIDFEEFEGATSFPALLELTRKKVASGEKA